MIYDKLENISKYPLLAPYEEQILNFIKRLEEEKLADGKYLLNENNFFAVVQRYTTKEFEDGCLESHKKYADFQYLHEGEERVYISFTNQLKIKEDKTPDTDILFYDNQKNCGFHTLSKGYFGYYMPQDAHMPCIKSDKIMPVLKIVFKIAV